MSPFNNNNNINKTQNDIDNLLSQNQTPEYQILKPDPNLLTSIKLVFCFFYFLIELLLEEKDDRYRYLIKHGSIHFIESHTFTLFVELPQIPHIIIVYRRPSERLKSLQS